MSKKDIKMGKQVGQWRDTVRHKDGTVEVGDWHYNQIQVDSQRLIMAFLKESAVGVPATFGGLQYLALGEGAASWDLSAPTQDTEDQTLTSELARIQIDAADMFYLDDVGAVSLTPTRRLKVSAVIPFSISGDLREFALFGGDATSTVDTGFMFNWIVHPRIEKTNTQEILREVIFTGAV